MFNLQTVELTLPYLEHAKECFACGTNYYTFGESLPVQGLCSKCNTELIAISKEDELLNKTVTDETNFEL